MAMDPEVDEALLRIAKEAEGRWRARRNVREKRTQALDDGNPLGADTPSRLAARVNTLLGEVRRAGGRTQGPANDVLRQLVERQFPVVAEDITREIVNEAIIGAADFLSVEFLERGVAAARSVGRILTGVPGVGRARGTGFLVGPQLLLTNQHVLTSPGVAANCLVQMDYEQSQFGPVHVPQEFVLEPGRFFLMDEALDFALVAVARTSARGVKLSDYDWLPLTEAQGTISISDNDHINIVQHPRGEEKQVVLRDNRVLDMRTGGESTDEKIGAFLHYQADTDKGSSGSPVMSDSWQVIALHHSGVPDEDDEGRWLRKDGKLWIEGRDPVDDICWVANEAVRISGILSAAKLAQLAPAERQFLDEALAARLPDRASGIAQEAIPDKADAVILRNDKRDEHVVASPNPAGVSFDVPLRVTLSFGEAAFAVATDGAASAPTSQRREPTILERIDPADLKDRKGYVPDFLGFDLQLPGQKARPCFGGVQTITRPSQPGDRQELRYDNYSVLMCAGRRLAYVSACNVDFDAAAQASSKQGGGNWRFDPRIPNTAQLGAAYYERNDYDRGHLSRRDDLARGDTLEAAIAANRDSFFWTNCAPQHFLLNRSTEFTGAKLQLWGDLENHISAQGAENQRLSIFNGPIFGEADKPLRDALVPLAFYKIVVWKDANGSGAVGFVLEQGDLVASLPDEALDPGVFVIRQRRITAISAELDLDFGAFADLDRMPVQKRGRGAAKEALTEPEIHSVADIQLG